MSIKEHCIKIYELLAGVGEPGRAKSFKAFADRLESNDDVAVYRDIISLYGGAGSFNDLVLYRDGKICMEENNELDRLRTGLYNAIAQKWN